MLFSCICCDFPGVCGPNDDQPNAAGTSAASDTSLIAMESDLPDSVYIRTLASLAYQHPNVPFVHIVPSVVYEWLQFPATTVATEQGDKSDLDSDGSGMEATYLHKIETFLRSTLQAPSLPPKYIVFHCSDVHYCSWIFNVELWKVGPGTRLTARSGRVKPFQRSEPVPFLHMDSLSSSCHFDSPAESLLLRRLCRVFNTLFQVDWPLSPPSTLSTYVHQAGPVEQSDLWSCGYHLLYAWARMLPILVNGFGVDKRYAVTADLLDHICKQHSETFQSPYHLVQFVRQRHATMASETIPVGEQRDDWERDAREMISYTGSHFALFLMHTCCRTPRC